MKREIPNRRPCINTRTDNFHFSVSFDPYTGHPVEFFITGRGKVGQDLDTELYELSVKASKLMQGEFEDDLPRMPEGLDSGLSTKGLAHPHREASIMNDPQKYLEKIPCLRCQGSGVAYCCDGEDASQPDPILGDQASTLEDQSMVA